MTSPTTTTTTTMNGGTNSNGSTVLFPVHDLVPKQETHADTFAYDGSGVVIGILDTGVDPATNRYILPNNNDKPKLINIIDCTGSGDVDVSEERELTEEKSSEDGSSSYYQVTGLTGRTLKLPKDWKIEAFPKEPKNSDESVTDTSCSEKDPKQETEGTDNKSNKKKIVVRLGVKRAYELFPQPVVARVQQERKTKLERALAPHVADLREKLADWNKARFGGNEKQQTKNNNKPTLAQVRQRDDWQARLDVLLNDDDNTTTTEDPGPLYDCVVFFDGQHYRAAVDVDETGDFTINKQNTNNNKKPLAAFGVEREYGTFGVTDQLNFGVQFYDHGKILSLVCDSSPHGTHVASIAACPKNGVAPAAQLISFKIGEPRLGTMETGPALARALAHAAELKCDVINLSYGEAVQVPDRGRFVELSEELVWKHGVTFVAAAGNQGPALSTVDAPGATTSACIGVAAYVSANMRPALYSSLPEPPLQEQEQPSSSLQNTTASSNDSLLFPETTYTWSSVGPAVDGDWGVNITAPGGAITTVPNWCLQKARLMNGTSMASPHATGCIALLMSACKAEGIPISPARIRRALENTAEVVPTLSPLQQGCGMLQVDKAWEYLKQHCDVDTEDVFFAVEVVNRSGTPRGIYLRQPDESSVKSTFSIKVDPQFRREDDVSDELQKRKIDLEMHFCLKSSAPSWVRAPKLFALMNTGRSFDIEVDPTGLSPGVHTAKVCGIEADKPSRKALFSVPITVIKPLPTQPIVELGALEFEPAEVKRFFVVPPPGSTWMDVTLCDRRDASQDGEASSRVIALHTVQLLPHAAFRDNECSKRMSLLPSQKSITSIAVEQGVTCEVALAKFWSTRGPTKVDATIQFRGIVPVPNEVHFGAGSGGAMVRIHCDLANESVNPEAKLTKWQTPVRPKACVVSPLGDRDRTSTGKKKTYQLVLTYEFEQEEKGSFVPRAPALNDVLYESGFESQCMLVFDGDKKYLGMSDAFSSTIADVPKGTITIRLEIRHDDAAKLEKFKDLVIWIERSLSKEVALPVYPTREDLMLEKNTFKKRTLRTGTSAAVFISEPQHSKLPTGCGAGHRLVGTISYGSGDAAMPGDGKKPGGYPICFNVGPKPAKDAVIEAEPAEPKDKPTAEQKMNEAVRDLKIEHLGKLTDKEKEDGKFDELYAKLKTEYPDHIPLLMAKLKYVDSHSKRLEMLNDVVAAAEDVISSISEDELALNLGRKVDSEDGDAVKERDAVKEKKNALIEALVRLAMAYGDMKSSSPEDEAASGIKFDETLKRLKQWADIESYTKYAALYIQSERRAGRFGLALKTINKLLNKDGGVKEKDMIKVLTRSELLDMRAQIFEQLGYSALVDYDKKMRVIACPKSFTPF